MEKVSNNVYLERHFSGCNVSFVITGEGIVMIDSPENPAEAIRWREEISQFGTVKYLINTEPHADHYTGNYFFKGTIVSHEGTRNAIDRSSAKQFKERFKLNSPETYHLIENFKFRLPSITFSDKMTIHLGDLTFNLIHMPGHTPYQVAVFIPQERVIFTSDNVVGNLQPAFYQAVPYDWIESLDKLKKLDADVFIPGHGTICNRAYLKETRDYIKEWIDTVSRAKKASMTLEEAQKKISFIDRYPVQEGIPFSAQDIQRMNIDRLYEVL
jgi:cyclase